MFFLANIYVFRKKIKKNLDIFQSVMYNEYNGKTKNAKGGKIMKPNEIRAARVRLGLRQKDAAKVLNISNNTYSQKEIGNEKFKIDEIFKLAKLYRLTRDQIDDFFFDGKMKKFK